MLSLFSWLTTTLSITGVILNVKKLRVCFFIWAFTNFSWMVIDFKKEIYSQSFLFLIYFILALWGIYSWRRKES